MEPNLNFLKEGLDPRCREYFEKKKQGWTTEESQPVYSDLYLPEKYKLFKFNDLRNNETKDYWTKKGERLKVCRVNCSKDIGYTVKFYFVIILWDGSNHRPFSEVGVNNYLLNH